MPTLDWIGKNAVVGHHKEVPYRLIKCDKELSAGEAGEGNLLVEGDNLHALKALLPYYGGKVKCIYIDLAFRDLPYDIVPQFQITDLNGKILGLLDLHFKHRHSKRDYFAFEAKRLHVTRPGGTFSNEHSIYVGNEGMMAFIDGQYSKSLPAGGMLGYVMDGDTKKAWDGLETQIENRRRELKLASSSKLAKSLLSHIETKGMEGTLLGETSHQLEHKLRLFHLLLPVTASN